MSVCKFRELEVVSHVNLEDVLVGLGLGMSSERFLQRIPASAGWQEHACAVGFAELMAEGPFWVCAVTRRRFPVGANPTRRPLQPEATGAAMEVTK